jgi:hypothetical protein
MGAIFEGYRLQGIGSGSFGEFSILVGSEVPKIQAHRELLVWQKSMHPVEIAHGSLMELERSVMIAERLGYAESAPFADVFERITQSHADHAAPPIVERLTDV